MRKPLSRPFKDDRPRSAKGFAANKKIVWIAIGCICIALIGVGASGFADTPAAAELSQEAKGQFVRVDGKKLIVSVNGRETPYPIAANVWVYRNNQKAATADLKAGDAVEVIFNSKQQAAYVKASGAAESSQPPDNAASQSDTAAASGTSAVDDNRPVLGPALPRTAAAGTGAAAAGQPNTAQKPSGSTAGKPSSPSASSAAAGAARAWEKLSFEWKSRDLELKAKQEPGKLSASEMYLKTKDRSVIRLDGAAAESFIQLLVKDLPKEPKAFEQALKQKIASDFQLAGGSADWKIDVKWAEEPKSKGNEKPKGNGKEKEHGKGNEKRSDNDDDR